MHEVILKYRPVPWIPLKKTIRTIHPEDWNELTSGQMVAVVEFLNTTYSAKERDALVCKLLSLKSQMDNFPDEVLKLHDFIKLKNPIYYWVIKEIKVGDKIFYGPADQFRNVTIGEFAYADTFFIKYLKDANPENLYKTFSCYYRQADPHPDPLSTVEDKREPFNPKYVNENSKLFSQIDPGLRNAIEWNYKNIRVWIQNQYTWVFPPATENSKKNSESGGWRDFIRSVINGDYVNQEKILQTLLHTVLYDMNQKIKIQTKQKHK